MAMTRQAAKLRGIKGFEVQIWTMPLYRLLVSIAGWYALWQLITAPFY